jgi:hypothetical protein
MDSQVLTDHQRDVRERQQMDAAAMFPDIRSSPKVVVLTDKRHFQQRDLSPGLPSAIEWVADNSVTPMLPPPPCLVDDAFTGSSPAPKGDYTPPSSPPVPIEEHTTGRESDLSSFPMKGHEEAEFGGINAQGIFRASAQQYLDRAEADDLELYPSVEKVTATIDKVGTQISLANVKKHDMAGAELELLDTNPGEDQHGEIGTFEQEYEEIGETTQLPGDDSTISQAARHTETPEFPKTPPPQRRHGAVEVSPRPFTPETQTQEPDLFTTIPQSPQGPREGSVVEVSGTADNIEKPSSVDPARTRPGVIHRTSTPDGGDVNQIVDSHAKHTATGVAFAAPTENHAAEDSEPEWRESTEKSPLQSLRSKRKRLSLFSPRKPKRTKQDTQDDEEIGDCIIVMPSPQKSPPLPKSATRKTPGKNTKNSVKPIASLGHSGDGSNSMLLLPLLWISLMRLTGTHKRLVSELILHDDGEETPTGRKKSK